MQFLIPGHIRTRAGVYAIRNTIDERLYIGSSQNFYTRYSSHKNLLKSKSHYAGGLQMLVNQKGLDILYFELVELAEIGQDLSDIEQKWLDIYQAYNPVKGFNKVSTVKSMRVVEMQHKLSFSISHSLHEDMSTLLVGSGVNSMTTLARILLTSAGRQQLSKPAGKLLDIELNGSEVQQLENLNDDRYLDLVDLIRAFLVAESRENVNFYEIDEKVLLQEVAKARGMKEAELKRSLIYDEAWRLGITNSL